jgi:hypothetical protein
MQQVVLDRMSKASDLIKALIWYINTLWIPQDWDKEPMDIYKEKNTP